MGVSFSRVDPTRPEGERRAGRVVRVGDMVDRDNAVSKPGGSAPSAHSVDRTRRGRSIRSDSSRDSTRAETGWIGCASRCEAGRTSPLIPNVAANYGARFRAGQIGGKKKSGPLAPMKPKQLCGKCLRRSSNPQAASSARLSRREHRLGLLDRSAPHRHSDQQTVMVPPAKSANSESWRPQSAPAIPSPNSATMAPTCPRDDHAVERGISRVRQRPMMPHT